MTTWIMLMLFGSNQNYRDALQIPGDLVLEIVESKLDEGLSTLEGDRARLARKKVQIAKSYGSVAKFVEQQMADARPPPGDILMPISPKP